MGMDGLCDEGHEVLMLHPLLARLGLLFLTWMRIVVVYVWLQDTRQCGDRPKTSQQKVKCQADYE